MVFENEDRSCCRDAVSAFRSEFEFKSTRNDYLLAFFREILPSHILFDR